MCEFFSFYIDRKGRIFNGNFISHESAEEKHGLSEALKSKTPPGQAEWTESKLTVRALDWRDANCYRASILDRWPTREKLIAHCLETKNYSSLEKALLWAAGHGQAMAVKLILAAGASAKDPEVLRAGVYNGCVEVVRALLDAGADATDPEALRLAAGIGRAGIVRILLDAGADAKDRAALQLAAWHGRADVVRILLDAGADATDTEALRLATEYGREDVVTLLSV